MMTGGYRARLHSPDGTDDQGYIEVVSDHAPKVGEHGELIVLERHTGLPRTYAPGVWISFAPLGLLHIRIDRVIYTTITLMSVLIVYNGWASLSFWGAAAVIIGPVVAIFLGHVFGAAEGTRVEFRRRLTGHERRALIVRESRFLLILVPPLTILVVLGIAGVSYTAIVQVIVFVGVLSLGFWGAVAGRRAGLTGWALVGSVAYGLFVGAFVLVLDVVLRPGQGTLQQ